MPLKLRRPRPAPDAETAAPERRIAQRFLCQRECVVRPEDATGIGTWSGLVYNISVSGIGVVLPYTVPLGKIIIVEPWGLGRSHTLRARVVRSVPRAFVFFHGCELIDPLTDEELRSWLA
jgi:hypothetical protein